VHHAGAAEERAVRIDDRRGVVRPVADALVQVEYDDHAVLSGSGLETLGCRSWNGLGEIERIGPGTMLRVEGREGQLRVDDTVGAVGGSLCQCVQSTLSVSSEVGGGALLNEGKVHGTLYEIGDCSAGTHGSTQTSTRAKRHLYNVLTTGPRPACDGPSTNADPARRLFSH
jgi:hypothetical protein